MNFKLKKKIAILFAVLCIAALFGVLKGSVNIPWNELIFSENRPILNLRLMRVLVAIVAGCGLSVSGIALQAILRNSLADPYLLGTSSGAGLGAVVAGLAGISGFYLPFFAFIGAILSTILVYSIAKEKNKIPEQSLILSGVIVSLAISAIMVFLISLSNSEALHGLTWWLWGSLQVYNLRLLFIVSLMVFIGILIIYVFSQDLNAIVLGEEEAIHLGINTHALKKILILVTALITAGLVSLCGIIGFVGLMIPHMMRLLVGPNHKVLIPATCIGAGIFMVFCDLVSRTLFSPFEIPIGVITAILGTPVFIFLLKNKLKAK